MASEEGPVTSHGRGGAANIGHDATLYTDGEIVREGPMGDQGNGAYSGGRGGAGNIESPRQKATNTNPGDTDVVPETAMRESGEGYENYHTGRGGEGNVHREKGTQMHEGLADKLKHKMFGKK